MSDQETNQDDDGLKHNKVYHDRLEEYLETTRPAESWPRVFCCNSSRSFYCCECCKICLPPNEASLPLPILEGRLRLPFSIDVILDEKERRSSSTGIQLLSIVNALEDQRELLGLGPSDTSVKLYDLGRTKCPKYDNAHNEGVYVLYPDKDSVPISSVSPRKLIVLDMKWSKPTAKNHPNLQNIQKVHLEAPPLESKFWRWHNHGKGMLSTIEALYFAAIENVRDDSSWTSDEVDNLIHIFWLFALQRSVINERSKQEQRVLPFSEAGKEIRRLQREQQNRNPPKKKIDPIKFYETEDRVEKDR